MFYGQLHAWLLNQSWSTVSSGHTVSRETWWYAKKYTLQKHAFANILKILQPREENFQIKNSDIFHISAQNIDRGYSLEQPRRGGSNEYP